METERHCNQRSSCRRLNVLTLTRSSSRVGRQRPSFSPAREGLERPRYPASAALYIAQKGVKTLLVTTDPAAHIGEVLDVKVGSRPEKIADNLFAVMVNQQEAFQEYKEKVLSEARGKYSEDMLATMEEELNSPCTEEMAAFDKFIQYIETQGL